MDLEPHPILTHFPIAAISFVLLFEVLTYLWPKRYDLRKSTGLLLILGATFTIASFITGLDAGSEANHTFTVPDEAISYHYTAARISLCLVPIVAIFFFASQLAQQGRKKVFTALYVFFLLDGN